MGRFPDTQWSLIRRSGETPSLRREAFSDLARDYQPAILDYFRAHLAMADAEEAAQSFLAASYEHGWWARADEAAGSFRRFLLVLLRRHLGHLRDRSGQGTTDLDDVSAWLPDPGPGAERRFDARFALLLAGRGIDRLRAEYRGRGRGALFDGLLRMLGDPPAHGELQVLAGDLGLPPNTVSVELRRLRKRLREAIRDELRHLCADEATFDIEWATLQSVLDGG